MGRKERRAQLLRGEAKKQVGLNPRNSGNYAKKHIATGQKRTLWNMHLFDYTRGKKNAGGGGLVKEAEEIGMRRKEIDDIAEARMLSNELGEIWDE